MFLRASLFLLGSVSLAGCGNGQLSIEYLSTTVANALKPASYKTQANLATGGASVITASGGHSVSRIAVGQAGLGSSSAAAGSRTRSLSTQ